MTEYSEDRYKLIHKRLTKQISQSENKEFEGWLNESPNNELLFRRLEDAWKNIHYTPKVKGQNSTFKRISKQLDFEEEIKLEGQVQITTGNSNLWFKIASVIIIFMMVAAVVYFNNYFFGNRKSQAVSSLIEKANPAGQKTRINLPDGSVCWLNSESKINYFSNFSDSTRDIYLVGEGYFEVAKNPQKPFRVHTPTMTVTALGTIFNVTSFPEDSKETVALAEGNISVKCIDDYFPKVNPGEVVQFYRNINSSSKMSLDIEDFIAWKNGELIFDRDDFASIMTKLERWYGVKFSVVGDPSTEMRYEAKFRNELLANVLKSMKYGSDFEYIIDGKNVQIMFN